MWYSFLGTTLTILFGLLISFVTEKISKSKVMSISKTASDTPNAAATITEKPNSKDVPIFTTEIYRKKSQTNNIHLHGIDNIALKIEDEH